MAKALNGSFTAELIETQVPGRTSTRSSGRSSRMTWYTEERFHSALGRISPAEYEEASRRTEEQTPQSA
ncbi:hypothetical protein G3I78_34820 [Streptomyces sp. SID13726]|nr:hypothetical protein [Streptomyces sp. SID13726]